MLMTACASDEPTTEARSDSPTETAETVAQEPAAAVEELSGDPIVSTPPAPENDGLFPTVVDVSASTSDGVSWRFDVTLLSEYDSPVRYADAWRVLDADDNELGIRVLAHDHASEQPFTRSTSVEIPSEINLVFIEGRDQVNGWNGERFEMILER